LTTPIFLVDNTRPTISGLKVQYPRVRLTGSDAMSTISEAAYSVDDGRWHVAATADGLFDEQSETLNIQLPAGLGKGTHTLAVRVADEAGNIGSASVSFEVQ
jgi:hypothetical protein